MSESNESSSWDRQRIEEMFPEESRQTINKLVELLGSVRAEAVSWTWTAACNQHDRGLDPRRYDMARLLEEATADLNPDRE